MDDHLAIRWALLAILLLFSAFFAGSEVALFSLTRLQIDKLKEKRGKTGKKIDDLLANPQRLLVSIYVGNELVNVAISAIITIIALELFDSAGIAAALGIGAFILIVFGEIAPKTFAHHHNERLALVAAYPLSLFMVLIYPVQVVVTATSGLAVRVLGGEATIEASIMTEEEVMTLMEEGADDGVIDEGEKEMIQNVFDLGDVTVADIMTPRTEIVAISIATPMKEAWDQMAANRFARAPVFRESIDNIEGLLFKKDLLKLEYPPPQEIVLASLIRPPFIVPETMTINELLREFKKRKIHIAIAMDEYGGVNGIATLDDVIRELVGETMAGGVENGARIIKIAPGAYRLSASCELGEFNEFFDASLALEDIETIGGYVFHLFGEPPKVGRTVEDKRFVFTVEKVKGPRITRLKVLQKPEPKPEEKA